jgi:hypothetical protein
MGLAFDHSTTKARYISARSSILRGSWVPLGISGGMAAAGTAATGTASTAGTGAVVGVGAALAAAAAASAIH